MRGLLLWLIRPSNRSGEGTTFWLLGSLLPSLALTALTVAAGTTLIIGHGGGLYWLLLSRPVSRVPGCYWSRSSAERGAMPSQLVSPPQRQVRASDRFPRRLLAVRPHLVQLCARRRSGAG